MKINIISIGNFKNKDNYKELFSEYRKRLKWEINLIEIKNKKYSNIEEQKNQEGIELLKHIDRNNKLIVLDERGQMITTNEFDSVCSKYFEISSGIDFIIGGSDGLSQEVRDKSDFLLSFGKMVYPHLMVRVMLIEQLYRVYTLRIGHPYHK